MEPKEHSGDAHLDGIQSSANSNCDHISVFESRISKHRERVLTHPIYKQLRDLETIQCFMTFHVFAVWDFMSLLKTLQRKLTFVDVPWLPAKDPQLSRFINEIVLAEESDEIGGGQYLSHFELYLRAMDEIGADTTPVLKFIGRVRDSDDFEHLLAELSSDGGVFKFMQTTFQILRGEVHEVATAFLFGREDIIPEMFSNILKGLDQLNSDRYRFFRQYLERHIQLDGNHHGPMARQMLISLCGDSTEKWQQAERAAFVSIDARIMLWDFIASQLSRKT